MTILVTGGNGVVGRYVVRRLCERGERVVVADLAAEVPGLSFGADVAVSQVDIRDYEALEAVFAEYRPQVVIHLAAMLGSACSDHPVEGFQINMGGTVNVLEAARRHGIGRMVFASTRTVYPDFDGTDYGAPTFKPVPETHPLDPVRPYEVWKHGGERIGRFYAERYGFEFTALRFAIYFAPERTVRPGGRAMGAIHRMLGHAARGEPLHLPGGGDQVLECVYVKDLAEVAVLAATAAAAPSSAYNVGTGELITVADFAAAIRQAVPDAEIDAAPGGDFAESHYCVLDITRSRRELGYEPRFTLAAAVADCIEAIRAGGH